MADFEPFAGMSQEETQLQLVEMVLLLKQAVKLLESLGNVDATYRQRVTASIDYIQAGITNAIPVSVSSAAITTLDGRDRNQFADNSNIAYNTGIRANLGFQ